MKKIIGIDFGTSNTFIYVPNKGSVYNEPTLIAINVKQEKMIETGYLASKMIGRTPADIQVIHPVINGVVARINPSYLYLKNALEEAKMDKNLENYSILFGVPSDITPVEKNALIEIANRLDIKDVILQNQGLLATLGSGIEDDTKKGNMTINIGGGITDISVVSEKDIIISKSSYFSGDLLDQTILRHLRKKHHLLVGEKTAEFIKMKIGSVEIYPENRLVEVSGRDISTSLPHSIIISTSEIRSVILPKLDELIDAITDVLALTPPEISADIISNGICISGGGALLSGIREYLEKTLNIPVRIAPDPLTSVVNGMRVYINELDKK